MAQAPKLPNSLQTFTGQHKGLVRNHTYEIIIAGPGFEAANADIGLDARNLTILCENAQFPGSAVGTQPNRIYGPVRELAYEKIFSGDLSLTFRMDKEMRLRELFNAWQKVIHDPETGDFGYYDDYRAEILVYQYPAQGGTENGPIYGVRCTDAYPKSIAPLDVAYDQTNSYMRQTVDFAYRTWEEITE